LIARREVARADTKRAIGSDRHVGGSLEHGATTQQLWSGTSEAATTFCDIPVDTSGAERPASIGEDPGWLQPPPA